MPETKTGAPGHVLPVLCLFMNSQAAGPLLAECYFRVRVQLALAEAAVARKGHAL